MAHLFSTSSTLAAPQDGTGESQQLLVILTDAEVVSALLVKLIDRLWFTRILEASL